MTLISRRCSHDIFPSRTKGAASTSPRTSSGASVATYTAAAGAVGRAIYQRWPGVQVADQRDQIVC